MGKRKQTLQPTDQKKMGLLFVTVCCNDTRWILHHTLQKKKRVKPHEKLSLPPNRKKKFTFLTLFSSSYSSYVTVSTS